jgi:tRNA uridine 5-carboxymethylaminomethyl modification enzyme
LLAPEAERLVGKALEREYNLADLLRRPGVDYDRVNEAGTIAAERQAALRAETSALSAPALGDGRGEAVPPGIPGRLALRSELGEALADAVVEQVEISIKYAGYIDKQNDEVERAAHFENMKLPAELDYMQVSALSIEARQKLSKHRPETLGQASRISGITPAAISLLLIHLKKGKFKGFASPDGAEDSTMKSQQPTEAA